MQNVLDKIGLLKGTAALDGCSKTVSTVLPQVYVLQVDLLSSLRSSSIKAYVVMPSLQNADDDPYQLNA